MQPVAAAAALRQGRGMTAPRAAAALAALLASAPAFAQEEETPGIEAADGGLFVSGEASILSDYRFRGISRSDEDPALQGQLTVSTLGGFYAGARGTTLKDTPLGDAELDLYAGYAVPLGLASTVDVGLMYYWFPTGSGDTDYFEPYASLSHTLGPAEGTVGVKYAPKQAALGDEDVLYAFAELEGAIPLTPVTLTAGAGWQDAGGFGRYWNWSLGGRYAFGPVEAGLRYVDTDLPPLPGQDAGLVLSLGMRF